MFNYRKAVFIALITVLTVFSSIGPKISPLFAQQPPVAKFAYAPKVPFINQTVTFDASASYDPDGTILVYRWDFGDGTSPVSLPDKTTTHAYSAVGNYTVTLTVTDNQPLQGNTSAKVTVDWYPTADFTYTPPRPLVNQTVTFNASASKSSIGTIVSYYWDFGDGNTANVSASTTTHAYSTVGNYSATLTVTDSYGFSGNCTKSIAVVKTPVADFTFTPAYPKVGETVTFNATMSKPDGGTIINYYWDFGDGQNTTGVVVAHAYATYGSFTVTLNITDSEGLSNATQKQVNVRQNPTASFTYTPNLPYVNQTVTLDASASQPNGGTIISYVWDFGDGSTGAGAIVHHAYAGYGTHYVNLTVTDSEQLSNTSIQSIRVVIGPVANFTHTPVYPAMNTSILFNASQSFDPDGSIVAYAWDFGDGNTVTRNYPLVYHTYATANVYIVSLTVTEDDNLTANATMTVPVYTSVPTHDVAIAGVTPSASVVIVGNTIYVNVTAQNKGTVNETFDVSVYYGSNLLGRQTVTNLAPNSTQILQFSWNTTGVPFGYYNITATASTVIDETNTADNTLTDGQVIATILGDISGPNGLPDLKIDMRDIARVARAFGSDPVHEPKAWDPVCDLNHDGKVDMRDVAIVAKRFGWNAT